MELLPYPGLSVSSVSVFLDEVVQLSHYKLPPFWTSDSALYHLQSPKPIFSRD